MQRTTQLLLAAGFAGALFASAIGQFLLSPSPVSASWDRTGHNAEVKTGTVDVLGLLEVMLDYEPYRSAREAQTKSWNDQIEPLVAQRDAAVQSLQQFDPSNPDEALGQSLYQQYQQLDQRIRGLSQQAGQAIDEFSAGQLADAYEKIHQAVQTVAEAQGIDRVFSSRMDAEEITATNTNIVVQEVLLRPVLRDTGAVNLTDLVRKELGIPETPPEGPVQEPGASDQPGGQPAGQPTGQPDGN